MKNDLVNVVNAACFVAIFDADETERRAALSHRSNDPADVDLATDLLHLATSPADLEQRLAESPAMWCWMALAGSAVLKRLPVDDQLRIMRGLTGGDDDAAKMATIMANRTSDAGAA